MYASKTILQMKYARIVKLFADATSLSFEDALSFFYSSLTYNMMSHGIADMHCRSDLYLTDELIKEWREASGA